MICKRCGAEVADGMKFCGNCGERTDGKKTCPRCGIAYEGNFCGECGYGERQERQKIATGAKTPAIAYLRYVAAGLFALFAALLFVFYSAPMVKLFGESLGSVYEVAKEELYGELQSGAKSLITLAVVGVVLAVGWFVVWLLPATKNKKAFKELLLGDICAVVGAAYYLIVFIFGCVFAGKIKKEELEAGAVATLMIAFSLFFLLLSLGTTAVWLYFNKKLQISANDGTARKKEIVPLEKPVAPETVEKPVFMGTKEMDDLCELRIRQYKSSIGILLPLLAFGIAYWLFIVIGKRINVANYWEMVDNSTINGITLIVSFFVLFVLTLVCKVIVGNVPYTRWNIRKIKNKGETLAPALLSSVTFLGCIGGVIWNIFFKGGVLVYKKGIYCNLMVFGVFALVYMSKAIKLFALHRRCKKAVKAVDFTSVCVEYEKNMARYNAEQSAYKEYLRKKAQYEYDEKRYAAGKREAKRVCGVAVWLKNHKKLTIRLAALVVVVAVLGGVQIKRVTAPDYIFRVEKVSEICLNDTQKDVEKTLGKPHRTENGYYEYFTEEYKATLDKIARLERQAEQAQEDMDFVAYEELLEKQATLKYDYIRVMFDEDERVESVRLEIGRCDSAEAVDKTDDTSSGEGANSSGSAGGGYRDASSNELYARVTNLDGSTDWTNYEWQAEIYYADGCYQKIKVLFSEENLRVGDGVWFASVYEDEWGSVPITRTIALPEGVVKGLFMTYRLESERVYVYTEEDGEQVRKACDEAKMYISGRGSLSWLDLSDLMISPVEDMLEEIVIDERIELKDDFEKHFNVKGITVTREAME